MLGLLVEGMGCTCHLDGPAVKWERTRELDMFIAQEKTSYKALWGTGKDCKVSEMSAVAIAIWQSPN